MYEFGYTFNGLKKIRPSFVGSDHADEVLFVFGACFLNGHMKITGKLKIIVLLTTMHLVRTERSRSFSLSIRSVHRGRE